MRSTAVHGFRPGKPPQGKDEGKVDAPFAAQERMAVMYPSKRSLKKLKTRNTETRAMLIKYFSEFGDGERAPCQLCGRNIRIEYAHPHHKKKLGFEGCDAPELRICLCFQCHLIRVHGNREIFELVRDHAANVENGQIIEGQK
jgi:hypothetical protein